MKILLMVIGIALFILDAVLGTLTVEMFLYFTGIMHSNLFAKGDWSALMWTFFFFILFVIYNIFLMGVIKILSK